MSAADQLPDQLPEPESDSVVAEMSRMDRALYAAVATTPTPRLDKVLRDLTRTADKSVLWFGIAGALALAGGDRGRRAALTGVASIGAASLGVNVGVKTVFRRRRPDRPDPVKHRFVPMPRSTSFPSGHSASAFAFAQGVSSVLPAASVPLHLAAVLVAYSRVHTGVHYPGDVVIGSLIGIVTGGAVGRLLRSRALPGIASPRPSGLRSASV
ncbi:MAG: phosphatase PAP2 family protein [Candidatus Nanopelagicales bacterium]